MATAAIGSHRRAVLRRQAMVTFKKCFHPVAGQFVFGIEPLRGVAAAAHPGGDVRRSIFQPGDFVFGMAIGTGGCVTHAGVHGLAMHTGRPILHLLVVAGPAGFSKVGIVQRRRRQIRRQNLMGIVAILAGRGVSAARFQRQAVDAGVIAFGLLLMADGAVDRLQMDIIVGMFDGDVGMATDAGVRFMGRSLQFGFIDEQGNGFAGGVGNGQSPVRVTIQTIAVLQTAQCRQDASQCQEAETQPP